MFLEWRIRWPKALSMGASLHGLWGPFLDGFKGKPKENHLPGGPPIFQKHSYGCVLQKNVDLQTGVASFWLPFRRTPKEMKHPSLNPISWYQGGSVNKGVLQTRGILRCHFRESPCWLVLNQPFHCLILYLRHFHIFIQPGPPSSSSKIPETLSEPRRSHSVLR